MTVFGPINDAGVAEHALLNHLKLWLPTYLAEVDRQRGLVAGATAVPRSWQIVQQFDLSEEPQMPAVIIESPGPNDTPKKEGDGTVRVTYEMRVISVVAAKDYASTNDLGKRYAGAIMDVVMQKRSLGDPNVMGTDFMGYSHVEVPTEERRTKVGIATNLEITYRYAANWKMGPSMPIIVPDPNADPPVDPTDPYPDPATIPDADHVHVTITKEDS